MVTDTERRLRALHARSLEIGLYGNANGHSGNPSIAIEADCIVREMRDALPGLLDENERLRTALASIKFDADYHGKSCNFQSAECHHETYREMSEIAFRALEGHDAKG